MTTKPRVEKRCRQSGVGVRVERRRPDIPGGGVGSTWTVTVLDYTNTKQGLKAYVKDLQASADLLQPRESEGAVVTLMAR